jgi:hypothetical protein
LLSATSPYLRRRSKPGARRVLTAAKRELRKAFGKCPAG